MAELGLDLSDGDVEVYRDKCNSIIEWADENPRRNFDTTFVENLLSQMEESDRITDRQKAAIDRIISTFEIE